MFTTFLNSLPVAFLSLLLSSICHTFLAVYSLSFIPQDDPKDRTAAKDTARASLIRTTHIAGIFAAAHFLALPYIAPGGPLGGCVARALCFACACKILDLTVARANKPPKQMKGNDPIPTTDANRLQYVWLLLRECRYHSFDIATIEQGRDGPASTLWTFGPGIVLPILAYFVPCSETRFLLTLLIIHAGMESCHSILHPSSKSRLFYQPFAATSISAFWRTHWQQDAASFLYSLAYAPARDIVGKYFGKNAGRAAGVLAAFNLSGIWHGWAAAVLTTTPWRSAVGMWALFVMHGVLCLVESVGGWRGGWVQRLLAWGFAVWSTGCWMRDAERHVSVEWLRRMVQ